MTARENSIVRAIQKRAATVPDLVVRKRHGTASSISGDPDLYGSWKGRHFEIEVKREGGEPTPLQEQRLAAWAKVGAITGCAHSVGEFFAILNEAK